MSITKTISLLFLLTFTLAHYEQPSDFEFLDYLINLEEEEDKPKEQIPVSLERCLDNPIFVDTKLQPIPENISRGYPIEFHVTGLMMSEQQVKELRLEVTNNGNKIETPPFPYVKSAKKGKFVYKYKNDIPAIIPTGNWEIKIRLVNDKEEVLSCIRANFVIPDGNSQP